MYSLVGLWPWPEADRGALRASAPFWWLGTMVMPMATPETDATRAPSEEATRPHELPRAPALNSFRLRCPGVHHVTRLPLPESREARRELERSLGISIFAGQKAAYAAGEVEAAGASVVELACDVERGLHLFDLRAALASQARQRGYHAWFGFGGELHIAGLPGEERIDEIIVQRRLPLRVVDEGWALKNVFRIGKR